MAMFAHLEDMLADYDDFSENYFSECDDLTRTTFNTALSSLESDDFSDDDDDLTEYDEQDHEVDMKKAPQTRQASMARLGSMPKLFISDALRSFLQANAGSDFQKMDLMQATALHNTGQLGGGIGSPAGIEIEIQQEEAPKIDASVPKPQDLLNQILSDHGICTDVCSYKKLREQGHFLTKTPEMVQAYDAGLMSAVRRGDLQTVQQLDEQGKPLQCCNQFAESIVHTVCRRGHYDVLEYLVKRAGVKMNVCCESGRVPLHDACWTARPNFDAISLIVQTYPGYWFVADNRNFTPLAYAPKESWPKWQQFLETSVDLLVRSQSTHSTGSVPEHMRFI